MRYLIIFLIIFIPVSFAQGEARASYEWSNKYFSHENARLYNFARKIEAKQTITLEDVKSLPEGSLNRRYTEEMTLLFFALNTFNAEAIDVLLEAGADPYMVDRPSLNSGRDFTYYFAFKNERDVDKFTPQFVNAIIKSYLKHGGDPNHVNKQPTLYRVIMSRNIEGIEMFVNAGADILAPENAVSWSAATSLLEDFEPSYQKLLFKYIDRGLLDGRNSAVISKLIRRAFPLSGKQERNELAKINVEKLLYRYPDIKDNFFTNAIFKGPIPWKEINQKYSPVSKSDP